MQTVVRRLVELEVPLRSSWDPARISFKDASDTAAVSECTDAIRSDFFWSYLRSHLPPLPRAPHAYRFTTLRLGAQRSH